MSSARRLLIRPSGVALHGRMDEAHDVLRIASKAKDLACAVARNAHVEFKYPVLSFDVGGRPQLAVYKGERLKRFDAVALSLRPQLFKLRHGSPPRHYPPAVTVANVADKVPLLIREVERFSTRQRHAPFVLGQTEGAFA